MKLPWGFRLLGAVSSRSMNLSQIVLAQSGGYFTLVLVTVVTLIFVYWVSGVAETIVIHLIWLKVNPKLLLVFTLSMLGYLRIIFLS